MVPKVHSNSPTEDSQIVRNHFLGRQRKVQGQYVYIVSFRIARAVLRHLLSIKKHINKKI